MKRKFRKIIKYSCILLLILLITGLFFPTWTPEIPGENSISELRKVKINDTELEVMIRGNNRDNPVVIFVHGGPCCSEIPYVRKYQDLLEQSFTMVHYDQRGTGKSYQFGTDYSNVNAAVHVKDLLAFTQYIEIYLQKEKVILAGHSFGTYLATMAAAQEPERYSAYIGIGQMSDTITSELITLQKCVDYAKKANNQEDQEALLALKDSIAAGKAIVPRDYVRKYGLAARKIEEDADYRQGFLFGSEYNLLDAIRFYTASNQYQEALVNEGLNNPISDIVTDIPIPVYFVMGQYDGMTAPEAADEYLKKLTGNQTREMVIFENAAHYPQFEEKEEFYKWMCDTFSK